MFFQDGIFSKLTHTLKVWYLRSGMCSHVRLCGGPRPTHRLRGMIGLVVLIQPGSMLLFVTFVSKDHAHAHGLGLPLKLMLMFMGCADLAGPLTRSLTVVEAVAWAWT